MTWTPMTAEEAQLAGQVVTWISIARRESFRGGTWLPTAADITKSALLERLRSGKDPLPYPPPIGMSCPWYAAVEDPGPHNLGRELTVEPHPIAGSKTLVVCLWSQWLVVRRTGAHSFIVADPAHEIPGGAPTPYRWRLWFDPAHVVPTGPSIRIGTVLLARAPEEETPGWEERAKPYWQDARLY